MYINRYIHVHLNINIGLGRKLYTYERTSINMHKYTYVYTCLQIERQVYAPICNNKLTTTSSLPVFCQATHAPQLSEMRANWAD